ncbi:MAG: hypothetical protein OES47_09405 [Acidobacteriota bacterium]|nr:hypothetical protein [Acidobacteriota bacterium]
MAEPSKPAPLAVIDSLPLIQWVDRELTPLLRSLDAADWERKAVKSWRVKDVAAHLLDANLRRLSLDRDGWKPAVEDDLSTWRGLVGFLDRLNAEWTLAAERLSPRVLIDQLETSNREVYNYFTSLDPMAVAGFPVSWAGEKESRVWMDLARELTEKWHHQQQIRDATERPGLQDDLVVTAVLDAFARALPRAYSETEAETGTGVLVEISDLPSCRWVLMRQSEDWGLYAGDGVTESEAQIKLPSDTAWRLFSKGLSPAAAASVAETSGPDALTRPFFDTLAIMG